MTLMPKTVRLLTQRIAVRIASHDLHIVEEAVAEGHDHPTGYQVLGTYDSTTNLIMLDRNMDSDRQKQVFLHENIHAMLDMANLDSILGSHAKGLDEHVCASMAPVMLSWLRENPRAVAYLMERT